MAALDRIRDKWVAVARSSASADRPGAERRVAEAYENAGLRPPDRCLWVASPLTAAVLVTCLARKETGVAWDHDGFLDLFGPRVKDPVAQEIDRYPPLVAGPDVGDRVVNRPVKGAQVEGARLVIGPARRIMDRLVMPSLRLEEIRDIRQRLIDEINLITRGAFTQPCLTQFDTNMLVEADFCANELGLPSHILLVPVLELAARVGSFWALRNLAVLVDRPRSFLLDERGRPHSVSGRALEYDDGFGIWALHGVPVPRRLIDEPESITIQEILFQKNVEMRRLLIERYGQARFEGETGAGLVHSDETGWLYRKRVPFHESLCLLRVMNTTPEPDGTRKEYWLRVPPTMRTSREAVAWTFGLDAFQYKPGSES